MLEFLLEFIGNRQLLVMTFAGVAAAATVLTLAMPLLSADQLEKRMAAVASERERIRQRERDRMARGEKASLRTSPRQYMQTVVEKFKLSDYVGQEAARAKLIEAGYRGHGPYVVFLFFRFVAPIAMLVVSLVYVFLVLQLDIAWTLKLLISIGATWLGMQLPNLFINNRIQRRQGSLGRPSPPPRAPPPILCG